MSPTSRRPTTCPARSSTATTCSPSTRRPARYRPREEAEAWINEQDPVQIFRADLLTSGFSPADLEALDAEAQAEIDEAMRFADESPWPEPAEAFEDVYAEG